MVDVTEILQHWYAGRPKVEVARSLGVDAKTVRRYVAPAEAAGMVPGGPPVTEEQWRALARRWFPQIAGTGLRQPSWGEIAVHHDQIAGLLGVVPVSVIHQRLAGEQGWRPAWPACAGMCGRTSRPGRGRARSGWPGRRGRRVRKLRLITATWGCGWIRRRAGAAGCGRFRWCCATRGTCSSAPTVSMTQRAWVEAHVAAFDFLGGVPQRLVPDNLKAGVCKPDLYDPKINRGYAELARHYGVLVDPARAYHPRDKATIEAHQRYIRSGFFAGRSWPSMAAMTADASTWCARVAGQRRPRALEGRTVAEVFTAEEAPALGPLPQVPFEPATGSRPKVAPDAHVIVGRTLYSVPYRLIGKRLDARATAATVEFYLDGELVKTHVFQPRGRRTDWADLPEHKAGFFMRTPAWCQAQARLVGPACAALVGELLAVNALFRLRQAQGVLRLGQRHGDARLEAACARAQEAGDPSCRTVKGILAAGTEHDGIQLPLPGTTVPAWLRGPGAFGGEQR
jgi:transposase